MQLSDIANLVAVRNHIYNLVHGVSNAVNKVNKKAVLNLLTQLDHVIVAGALRLDLEMPTVVTSTFTSSDADFEKSVEMVNKATVDGTSVVMSPGADPVVVAAAPPRPEVTTDDHGVVAVAAGVEPEEAAKSRPRAKKV